MRQLVYWLVMCGVIAIASLPTHDQLRASTSELRSKQIRREVAQSRADGSQFQDYSLLNLRSAELYDGSTSRSFDESIIVDRASRIPRQPMSVAGVPPPPSPGLPIAATAYDWQSNASDGYRVARMSGADEVHFTWNAMYYVPGSFTDPDRFVGYSAYDIPSGLLLFGFNGVFQEDYSYGWPGHPSGDVFEDNSFHIMMHGREDFALPYQPIHYGFPVAGSDSAVFEPLGGHEASGCDEALWTRIATSRDGDRTIHTLARSQVDCPSSFVWYWRHNGTTWTGPVVVDSGADLSHVVADDPTGDNLAVALHVSNYASMNGLNNVAYLESTTDGAGWIAGTEPIVKNVITNYTSISGPQAWRHISTCYDLDGTLHIAFDEQLVANVSGQAAIRHWNSQRQTPRQVAIGDWDVEAKTGLYNLNLSKLTMGIGDGGTLCQGGAESNANYVYILYTQFGGPTPEEQADFSIRGYYNGHFCCGGYYNGELHLTASNNHGYTWAPSINLTNTKTPNCNPGQADEMTQLPPRPDSVCRSEDWATIGMIIDDIDILFISDLDAGAKVAGEGTWQLNPVHYHRIPGGMTDAAIVCPLVVPAFDASLSADLDCEYHTDQAGTAMASLTLMNLGNAPLSGSMAVEDFPDAATLGVSGPGVYSIVDGDPDDVRTVTMSANGAPEGLYHGSISITHNDPNKVSPHVFPIDLFIFNEFYCPQFVVMKTGVASPGAIALSVSSDGRFGDGDPTHGMWRHADSSSSLNTGTLLIAHGPQGPDTNMFFGFGKRPPTGANGLRALGDLIIDTSNYGTGTGSARVTARLTTGDSVVGVTIEWAFPQDPSLQEFIRAQIKVYRHNPLRPITNLVLGVLADIDVRPSTYLGDIQTGVTNEPRMTDPPVRMIWIRGVDTLGHVPDGQNTATRFRAAMISTSDVGVAAGNVATDLDLEGGPSDGYLYTVLTYLDGALDLLHYDPANIYMLARLAEGDSIGIGETLSYWFALISDTVSEASLIAKAQQVVALGPCLGADCCCPCRYDPQCDSVYSNVQDVVKAIDVAFRGMSVTDDPVCPVDLTDVDADGTTSVTDVVRVINVAFRGQTVSGNYVDPCL